MDLIQTAGLRTRPQQTRTCIVYNGETGEIDHIHTVVTMEGAPVRGQREIEAEAMTLARQQGIKLTKPKTLFVNELPRFRPERRLKIDLAKLKLIDVD
ncbi:hypothetical protein M0L20_28475 [Spirosoma sp. RP8]|uniref:Uncharacterized protein n=1 Tax=Spirosoma liriopis TaxID=2937440 RepID=A0ABT0HV61_9BACT|nr:hypothetical protein [Spirosoma liriopis]MCK8495835.1 hypothetical protein [Spirosoma liriopis]